MSEAKVHKETQGSFLCHFGIQSLGLKNSFSRYKDSHKPHLLRTVMHLTPSLSERHIPNCNKLFYTTPLLCKIGKPDGKTQSKFPKVSVRTSVTEILDKRNRCQLLVPVLSASGNHSCAECRAFFLYSYNARTPSDRTRQKT